MFEDSGETPAEHAVDPQQRAQEKAQEIRVYAEMYAVFEGVRKFDATVLHDIEDERGRSLQKDMQRLEFARVPEHPILPLDQLERATDVLTLFRTQELSTNDYHVFIPAPAHSDWSGGHVVHDVIIVRWLAGAQVEQFYRRLQAHCDVGLQGAREDERAALEWKADDSTRAYLHALDEIEISMADRYLRPILKSSGFRALSTQTADELNLSFLTEQVMGITSGDLYGAHPAPDRPDPAMFFKLYSLRGTHESREHMCFLAFLQDQFNLL